MMRSPALSRSPRRPGFQPLHQQMPAPAQPTTEGCDGLPRVSRLLRAVEEKGMFMKRRLVWTTTIVVAALAAACNGAQGSGQSPTAPSAVGGQGSADSSQGDLTSAQTAALTAACGAFGSGPGGT